MPCLRPMTNKSSRQSTVPSNVMDSSSSHQRTGLIGHTGFVGGALLRQTAFDACFNSENITALEGQVFKTLVCAAAPGSMLEANRAPTWDSGADRCADRAVYHGHADWFVLISSIAVLAYFAGGDDVAPAGFSRSWPMAAIDARLRCLSNSASPVSWIVRRPSPFCRWDCARISCSIV